MVREHRDVAESDEAIRLMSEDGMAIRPRTRPYYI